MVFFTDKGVKRIESIPYQNCRIKKAIYKENVLVMILYNLITKKEELFIYDLKLKKQQLIPSTIIENQLIIISETINAFRKLLNLFNNVLERTKNLR